MAQFGAAAQDADANDENERSAFSSPAAYDAYIVQSGDSLYSIAKRFNTTVDALVAANAIAEPGQLLAGQTILIPAGLSAHVDVYEVQPGDTLFSLAKRFNTSIGILQSLNQITDGRSIFAGQSLIVPSVSEEAMHVYIVEAGDSLYGISQQFNTAVSVLKSVNGIADARDLQVGASILIPKTDVTKFEVYEVIADDSLYSLSRRFATTEEALITLNGLEGSQDLEAGQTILVPRIDGTKYDVHVVAPGDSLYNLARRFNTTVAQLRALNGIGGSHDMTVGRSILVPKVDATIFETVVIEPGDSLFALARRYNVSLEVLQTLNRLADPRDIRVGQTILIPNLENALLEVHVVKLGDRLSDIAEAYDTTVEFLQTLNGIADPSLIQLDDRLLVPNPLGAAVRPGFGFGLQVFIDRDEASALAALVAKLGVDWIKIDVRWSEIEGQRGEYNYAALDAMVAELELANVNILLNVYDAPSWSRRAYTEKLNSQMQAYGGPPEDLSEFAAFLANLATRYAGIVDAYEIWKSPNLLKFWTVPVYEREPELGADGDYGIPDEVQLGARYYAPLLQIAYETIKSHDDAVLVVSGGLAPVGYSDGYNSIHTAIYLQELLEVGAADYSDAIGAVFSASAVPPTLRCCDKPPGVDSHYESYLQYFPELMDFYIEVLEEHSLSDKPIMVTQVGWGTREGANIAIPSSGFEWLNYTSEDEQALYVTQAFDIVQDRGEISAMFLYNLNGCAVADEEACFFSLVDAAGSQRPAFEALQTLPKAS